MSYFWNTELEKYKTHANHISAGSHKNYLTEDILHIPFLRLPATLDLGNISYIFVHVLQLDFYSVLRNVSSISIHLLQLDFYSI